MNNSRIAEGDRIFNCQTKDSYRVLYVCNDFIFLCRINSNKIDIARHTVKSVLLKIRNNIFEVVEEKNVIFDDSSIPDKYRTKYEAYKELMKIIVTEYGPTYLSLMGKKHKSAIEDFISRTHFDRPTVWATIRRYLQSGFKDYSLLDQRFRRKTFG